jgi:glycosyltransferase involved in cell wall biosynthesis
MNILHIVNSLKKGGAEGNLYRLCKMHKKNYKQKINIIVVTLINHGYYEVELRKLGIKIFSLNLNNKFKLINFIKKIILFRKIIDENNPNIIQSWMYHSNFFSLFVQKKYRDRIFWNIRHSELNFKISKKITIFLSMICGFFSRVVPKKIIYCSEKSIKFHENNHFYHKNKTTLINNGYSETAYYPSKKLRINFKKKNKIKKSDIILGFAGRYAKQKNIKSILKAFSKIIKNHNNVYLFMVGKNISFKNKELLNFVNEFDLKKKVFFLNEQKNLLQFYNGIDLLILASHSESFPNVVAEAMLCSTPVLSSDAGCSKQIINNQGFILNKIDDLSIAKGLNKTINLIINKKKYWQYLKKEAQKQIKKNYSIEKMANNYFENWIF